LYPAGGGWSLPLTLRPADLRPHGGQISLPGGVVELGETSEQAARREVEEELGIRATQVRSLGALSDVYVFASNHLVTPWIGVYPHQPAWRPCAREVAEVIELPVAQLVEGKHLQSTCRCVGGVRFRSPHIAVGDHQVWGATCLILGELAQVLKRIP
ncbi:MAG: NUDIX domain-containing protein, partial [Planctomycetales bacterium]|nr:NUDIX domain-containing protein [Planctomycetales bacterium]